MKGGMTSLVKRIANRKSKAAAIDAEKAKQTALRNPARWRNVNGVITYFRTTTPPETLPFPLYDKSFAGSAATTRRNSDFIKKFEQGNMPLVFTQSNKQYPFAKKTYFYVEKYPNRPADIYDAIFLDNGTWLVIRFLDEANYLVRGVYANILDLIQGTRMSVVGSNAAIAELMALAIDSKREKMRPEEFDWFFKDEKTLKRAKVSLPFAIYQVPSKRFKQAYGIRFYAQPDGSGHNRTIRFAFLSLTKRWTSGINSKGDFMPMSVSADNLTSTLLLTALRPETEPIFSGNMFVDLTIDDEYL